MRKEKTSDRWMVTWELPMWLFIVIHGLSALGFLTALILAAELLGQIFNH